jgi:hypothetical protein
MSERAPRTCSRCGEEGHDVRTCEEAEMPVRGICDEDCLYELGGIYCPECHRS